jgi:hypothetical protein
MQKGSGSVQSCLKFLGRLTASPEKKNLIDLVQLGWAKIRRIEDDGFRPTGDIEIFSDDHCYVSSGLVMHNSAADLMMVGMRNIYRRLVREGLHIECGILLQVHDEVTIECPAHLAPYMCTLVREEMENAFSISVPIVSEGQSALSWGAAK